MLYAARCRSHTYTKTRPVRTTRPWEKAKPCTETQQTQSHSTADQTRNQETLNAKQKQARGLAKRNQFPIVAMSIYLSM